jgi:hypothetical protein
MFKRFLSLPYVLILICTVFSIPSIAQCLSYPVSLNERVNNATSILLGKVIAQHCYNDKDGNIFTLNKVEIDAWIKNHRSESEVYVITMGGVLNGKAQITHPAIQLEKEQRYFLMLENDNQVLGDPNIRNVSPGKIQAMPYADAQGAWLFQNGKYHDLFVEGAVSEITLLQKILSIAGLEAKKPDGSIYIPSELSDRNNGADAVTSFGPNPTNAGTVNPADFLTINGSDFGTTPGTVQFPNADNGGSTFITPPNTTDYVTWTDNTIVVKVPTGSSANAGTGSFLVNGTFSSPQPLVIRYSHISLNQDFSGFPTTTRQRYYLRNMDGLGGYTFVYSTNFLANTDAVLSFERALNTWKCNTGINWRAAGVTASLYANDDENVVLFDASLPAGVLARATSRFSGFATGTCNLENTVWWLEEVDIQARATGVTWQFGPGLATGTQYDFETVILHELGHAHGLGHRIAPGQLMNFSVANASNIRTPAPQEIQGGLDKMAYSTIPTCFDPTGSGTPMIAAGCPFPVKLISFTGELKRYGAELKWITQNEINSDKFEIQRSRNGIEYNAIGAVQAKGNSSGEVSYGFIDADIKPGTNYYRLKMVDRDGSYEYSSIVILKADKQTDVLSIYPNPVANELIIGSSGKNTLNLVDGNGKVVRRLQVNPGNNRFDVSSLSNGVYYVIDQATGAKQKLLVMH